MKNVLDFYSIRRPSFFAIGISVLVNEALGQLYQKRSLLFRAFVVTFSLFQKKKTLTKLFFKLWFFT